MPGVIEVTLPLVGVEVLGDRCALSQCCAAGGAGNGVVIDVGELGDDAHQIGPILAPLVGKALGHVGRHGQVAAVGVLVVGACAIEGSVIAAVVVGDAAPVAPQGEGVRTLVPGESVDEVVDRDVELGGTGLGGGLGEPAEVDPFAGSDAAALPALADIAIAQVVDDVSGGNPGVPGTDALGVVVVEGGGGLCGEVLISGGGVFLQISADKEVVLAVHVVVDLENAGVERGWSG
jgi:hypothetical protein